MSGGAFLDTSILVRTITRDIPHLAEQAERLVQAIAAGERTVHLSDTVVFETVHVLVTQK